MHVQSRIHVEAPPSVVWDVSVAVERWPEWSPVFASIVREDTGPFGVGSAAVVRQPGLPPTRWEVTELVPCERFTWKARARGLDMVATHVVAPEGGGARSDLLLELRGWPAVLLWPLLAFTTRRSLERENAALRERCEAIRTEGDGDGSPGPCGDGRPG